MGVLTKEKEIRSRFYGFERDGSVHNCSDPESWVLAGSTDHYRECAPAWIPRNGNDSQGMPCVVLTCAECLRAFPMNLRDGATGEVLEIPCRFCPSANRYTIQPST